MLLLDLLPWRGSDKKLSDLPHFKDDEEDDDHHNADYDHEAFLGKKEAHEYDDRTPEESKRALGIIFDKIDTDNNGSVTEQELRDWIRYVQTKYMRENAESQWNNQELDKDNLLTWENYAKQAHEYEDEDNRDKQTKRDRKRWELADQPGEDGTPKDGKLNMDEFAAFVHPEDVPHMRMIVIEETLDDIDKDRDGKVSLEEYIKDIYPNEENEPVEPDWVKTEREQFASDRDKNHDGYMDQEEVGNWIIPDDYDHSEAEAKHLLNQADSEPKDDVLTKEEVLAKYDLFIGSQATDFGDALSRHDEF